MCKAQSFCAASSCSRAMPPELLSYLQGVSLQKQFLKLFRMKEIAETAKDLK